MATNTVSAQHWIETYKSLIQLSIEGFRFAALVNGGAAIALLAYLGNIAGKSVQTPDMRVSMAAYLTGLMLCGLSMLTAYLTQLTLLHEITEVPSIREGHVWFLRLAILLLFLSIGAFAFGSWQAVVRF